MPASLIVYDETAHGERTSEVTIELPVRRLTVRELIRIRVQQEVERHNASQSEIFRGLVQPTDSELLLNGFKLRRHRQLNWQEQFSRAVEAFDPNGFFILVDDKQVHSLDDEVELASDTHVSFVKLVPLVGG